jgi:hypothetical protein
MDRLDARTEALIKKHSTLRQSMRTLKASMLKEAKSLTLDVLELDEKIEAMHKRVNRNEKMLIVMLGLWCVAAGLMLFVGML